MSYPAVPDVVAPPPGNRRFPLLDGMRAVAVVAVVLCHVSVFSGEGSDLQLRLLSHLNLGVTIFFLISGFLLYRPFISHRAGGPAAPGVGLYVKRRLLRIIPAYWLVLTVLTLLPRTTGVSSGEWLGQYALLHTLPLTGDQSCVADVFGCGLAQTWSLVVELTFYAALPLYVVVAERMARGRSRNRWLATELVALGLLATISTFLDFRVSDLGLQHYVAGSVLGFVLWFALGMALALVSVWLEAAKESRAAPFNPIARHPLASWGLALSIYVTLCLLLPATPFLATDGDQLLAYLGLAAVALLIMLPAVFADDAGGMPRRILRHPAVAWVGLISYGVFLWHYAVVLELGSPGAGYGFWPLLVVTMAITICIAAASYYLLERPILRFKYRGFRPRGGSTKAPGEAPARP